MCGRYTLYLPWSEIHRLYSLTLTADKARNTQPRYNICPTQDVLFVTHSDDGMRLREGRWGLVPFWANELGNFSTFNAKSEEADKKPMFREAFKNKRCLIPADGFYEWTKNAEDGGRDPWHIHLPEHAPFSFAGLWATNEAQGIASCTILTAKPVEPISLIHTRMPIILKPDVYEAWIDPTTSVTDAKELLKHHLDGDLQMYRVDSQINSSRWTGDETAIQPI